MFPDTDTCPEKGGGEIVIVIYRCYRQPVEVIYTFIGHPVILFPLSSPSLALGQKQHIFVTVWVKAMAIEFGVGETATFVPGDVPGRDGLQIRHCALADESLGPRGG